MGNYYETKGQSGFSDNVTLSGVSAFNVSVSKPSLGISVGGSGQSSFLNLDLGTRLQLGIGFGFNLEMMLEVVPEVVPEVVLMEIVPMTRAT